MGKNPTKHYLFPVLIVGSKNSGKTTFLNYLIRRAKQRKIQVAGFLSRGRLLLDGRKHQYFLEDISSGKNYLLATQAPDRPESIPYGGYFFDPEVFKLGNELLLNHLNVDLLVLDEFGPLELQGQGFRRAFDIILREYSGIFLITVRSSLLPEVKKIINQNLKKKSDRNFFSPKNSQ